MVWMIKYGHDIRGKVRPKFPDICFKGKENPQPGNWPRIEPWARWMTGNDVTSRSQRLSMPIVVVVEYMIFMARPHHRSLALIMIDFLRLWWPMISGDGWGLSFPDICLTVEEKPRKEPQSGNWPDRGSNPGPLCERQRRYLKTIAVVIYRLISYVGFFHNRKENWLQTSYLT